MAALFKLALSPALTGSLLFALAWGPENVTEPILQAARHQLSDRVLSTVITTLRYLFGLGVVREVNRILTTWAKNNYQWSAAPYDWPNEVVVITGGTGGFGSLMAKRFADRGATVAALDVKNNLTEELVKNPKIHYYECDITDRATVMETRDRIVAEHGHASVLINNAGLGMGALIEDCDEKMVRKVVDVNYVSHFWTVQAFLPKMIETRKGHIVTIASVASFVGPPTMSMYSSTKAALMGFHESLTAELRAHYKIPEIKTTIVHPTWSETPMTAPHLARIRATGMALVPAQHIADRIADQVLSGRGGGRLIVADPVGHAPALLRFLPAWISRGLSKS